METLFPQTGVQGDSCPIAIIPVRQLSNETFVQKRGTFVQRDTSIDFSPRELYVAHNYVCWVPLSPLVRPLRQVRVRATHKLRASSVLACDHRRESFFWATNVELTKPK